MWLPGGAGKVARRAETRLGARAGGDNRGSLRRVILRTKWRTKLLFLLAPLGAMLAAQQPSSGVVDLESGSLLYRANCAACHGPAGDAVPNASLRRADLRRGSSDEDLRRVIANGITGTAMPAFPLPPSQINQIIGYLRFLRNPPRASAGDPRRGRALLEGKGKCLTCHQVNGSGARLGPDLSEVGAWRPPEYLTSSLLRPDESILPQHRFVRLVTRDGTVITGRRLNEDTHYVQLLDSQERLVSFAKADLREYAPLCNSPMPSYDGKLSAQEMADLISYLVTLKGAP